MEQKHLRARTCPPWVGKQRHSGWGRKPGLAPAGWWGIEIGSPNCSSLALWSFPETATDLEPQAETQHSLSPQRDQSWRRSWLATLLSHRPPQVRSSVQGELVGVAMRGWGGCRPLSLRSAVVLQEHSDA